MEWFAFDTETTGLVENRTVKDNRLPEIIEFYGCSFNPKNGKVIKELNLLIKPQRPVSAEITRITGLTDADLKDKKPFKAHAEVIKKTLESQKLIFAHNFSYDREMVEIEMARVKMEVKWPKYMCTVEQTIHLKGFRLNLNVLHEHLFGHQFEKAHRAKNDVMAMVRCIVELHKRGEL